MNKESCNLLSGHLSNVKTISGKAHKEIVYCKSELLEKSLYFEAKVSMFTKGVFENDKVINHKINYDLSSNIINGISLKNSLPCEIVFYTPFMGELEFYINKYPLGNWSVILRHSSRKSAFFIENNRSELSHLLTQEFGGEFKVEVNSYLLD